MLYGGIWWLSFVCVLTLFGNILVILSVLREVSLHSATYYYIVSLALADLCVGVIVIPLAILFELVESPPSRYLCHLWHISDVGASTASILALCVISIDRYIAITSPIKYPRSFLARHSSIVIAAIWFCSSLLAGPIVIVLGERSNSLKLNSSLIVNISNSRCEFPSSPLFVIVSSSVSFYVPLLIMVFVYGRILIAARKQMTAVRQGYKRTRGINDICQRSPLLSRLRHRTNKSSSLSSSRKSLDHLNVSSNPNSNEIITLRIHKGKYSRSPSLPSLPSKCSNPNFEESRLFLHRLRNVRRKRSWSRFSREHKATKVLGFIMGVFIACWLPFFLFLLLTGVFHIHIGIDQEKVFRLFTWLGYTNSALNFLVYVLTSREFRLAFVKLLCPRSYIQRSLVKDCHQQFYSSQRI